MEGRCHLGVVAMVARTGPSSEHVLYNQDEPVSGGRAVVGSDGIDGDVLPRVPTLVTLATGPCLVRVRLDMCAW